MAELFIRRSATMYGRSNVVDLKFVFSQNNNFFFYKIDQNLFALKIIHNLSWRNLIFVLIKNKLGTIEKFFFKEDVAFLAFRENRH